ncbi:MAG: hypothetical protein CVV64_10195 [Candidatus Wallbacteria bacterium HGW-Wallbacteria-1]|jgi:UPF0716 protein FxsA|uniref:Membrane protein FxsA n=1 Tax=Candidatus Wallbacteria bacterium HGW-Wallbacteria-1 TaxID=2013854 RepID=A0A2N1PPR1_9BACT|nr:MAG: hypothetical protein CVV64_10195 [Candidatus Wallbacteria bacterium HGW-Wallbacteria-1]
MSFIAYFFLAVVVLSCSELYLLVEVASRFSFAVAFILCALTGIAGGAMVRHQGLKTLSEIAGSLSEGKVPALEIISGLMLLIIGAFLMVPGFITDTLGLLLLIPVLRMAVADRILNRFMKLVESGTMKFKSNFSFGFGLGSFPFNVASSENLNEFADPEMRDGQIIDIESFETEPPDESKMIESSDSRHDI